MTLPAPGVPAPETRIRHILHDLLDAAAWGLEQSGRPVPERRFVSWTQQAADGVQLFVCLDRIQPQNPVGIRTVSTNDHLIGIQARVRLARDWPKPSDGKLGNARPPAPWTIEQAADDMLIDTGALLNGLETLVRKRGRPTGGPAWTDGAREASIGDGVPLALSGGLVAVELTVQVGLS